MTGATRRGVRRLAGRRDRLVWLTAAAFGMAVLVGWRPWPILCALAVVGYLAGGLIDLVALDLSAAAGLVSALVAASVYGHAATKVERTRRKMTMIHHGFVRYSDYTNSPLWHSRRSRWLETHPNPPCRVCGIGWQSTNRRRFHLHHVDYSRACAGHEADRDLVAICSTCHTIVHRAWSLALRPLGFTLRANTWALIAAGTGNRLARRILRWAVRQRAAHRQPRW
jgi:hypothetical protein